MKKLLLKYAWFLSVLLILVGYSLLFRTAEVNGSSMEPTYHARDLLFMLRTESVQTGNIVAIYNEQLNELLCKRVIGVAGDHVVIDNKGLRVNNERVVESYVSNSEWYMSSRDVDIIVPDGEVFVMGDNRIVSNDSRGLGCMPCSDIAGVVIINVTQLCGVRRETLIRTVTLLIVASVAWEIIKRLRGSDSKITE